MKLALVFLLSLAMVAHGAQIPPSKILGGPLGGFRKEDYADPMQPANQDCITSSVCLTRGDGGYLCNIAAEDSCSEGGRSNNPSNTRWALGTTNDDDLVFVAFGDLVEEKVALPGTSAVLYLISDDQYVDILFTSWTAGGNGGGFSYSRPGGNPYTNPIPAENLLGGSKLTFSKPDGADWTLQNNQDCITESVCLTRGDKGLLCNTAAGDECIEYEDNNPSDTEWAFGTTDMGLDHLVFKSLYETTNEYPRYLPDRPMVLHLITDDVYVDIEFTSWSRGGRDENGDRIVGPTGGFSYMRSGGKVGSGGDPHVSTWSGKSFDWMGACDIVLMHSPSLAGTNVPVGINIRTRIRREYSFIESAALVIGSDILEVASFGDYAVNKVDSADLGRMGGSLSGYRIYHSEVDTKKHIFDVVLSPSENITFITFKDMVNVQLDGTKRHHLYPGSTGLMGSLDGIMLGRNGTEDMSSNTDAFANEWQVRNTEDMLFRTDRAPQFPDKCVFPAPKKAEGRRRLGAGLALELAEDACSQYSGASFENCVYDVMAVGDVDIAESGAY